VVIENVDDFAPVPVAFADVSQEVDPEVVATRYDVELHVVEVVKFALTVVVTVLPFSTVAVAALLKVTDVMLTAAKTATGTMIETNARVLSVIFVKLDVVEYFFIIMAMM
jgi:hypothetical protein